MDKYEHRRIKLIELKDNFCNGKISELANKLGRSDSYVSRMLYPDDKDGKKRIGDNMVDVIAQTFNVSKSWLDGTDIHVQQGSNFGNNNQFGNSNNFGVIHHSDCSNVNPPNFKMPDNSLSPIIPMQSELWVNFHDTEIIDEKVYFLEYGGMKLFRQVFRQPENQIKLVAYNSQFDVFVAPIDKIRILGRVISWKVEDLK
ncbi:TPA: helix-turn-helix transcriptional regulator [Neisseria meningitidis]|uniref:LexA family transcriptional regulator n=1 Tax=Kingella negevensis TaxID=1522312 RepID=UPI00254CCA45|nr:XRE family transcriptional regulator [Kingella negevensis]MDK4680044.1 S24 family peptidase [Kingella negevensis]MDK4682236.1 S24 family peptidase [Kingella negevensis]MDK4690433.1 S24 family peptidase [Kingella negevensis]MDK4692218.1 S24 family peptidase [Kingella negevensis]MDK4698522.1 S24 family peptidase [Kingella negevensis]